MSAGATKPRLPLELWLQIIELVEGKRELLVLCHTASILRKVILPKFQNLDLLNHGKRELSRQEQFNELRLVGAFRQPNLASIVTRFDIKIISSTTTCQPRSPIMATRPCHCGSLQKCIAEVLNAMINLEHLSIHCLLCIRVEKHHYFDDVVARKLRSFSCRCSCAAISHRERERMLLAPILSTIKSLQWVHGSWDMMHGWAAGSALDTPGILPQLTALVHCGKHSENIILGRRPIQRLCVSNLPFHMANFMRPLYTLPGSLTHIILENFFRLDYIITGKPECFRNIRHIGTIPAIPDGPEIESRMALFVSLPHLESIDVTVVNGNDPWDVELLSRLHAIHANLRQVFAQGDSYFAWKLEQTTWARTEIRCFSSWDIIRGALDSI